MEPEGSLQAANNATFSNVKPAHAIPADVFKIHFNINLPSMPRSTNCSLPFVCPHQTTVQIPVVPPPHHIFANLFSLILLAGWYGLFGAQYKSWSSTTRNFLPSPVTSSLPDTNVFLNTTFSNILSLRSSLNVTAQDAHPHKTPGKIIALYILL